MPRGLWKGTISFGLVNVPVQLFSAEQRAAEIDLTHEIRDPGELDLPSRARPSARELELALRLVDDLAAKWDPSKYKDTYRRDLMARMREMKKTREAA